jgi:hypothetical protein
VQGKPNQASEAVARVWAYWLEISGRSQKLDAKRSRIIRNALKLTSEDRVMQALYGLSCSPHHNGANEQHRAYLEIRYALKGIGDESDEERIEKAIGWGRQNGENRMDPDKVSRLLEAARYTWSLPHKPERARGEAARAALEKAGFRVEEVEGPPYLRIVR